MKHWLANFSATLVFIDSASEPRSEVLARVAGIGGGGLVFLFAHVVVGAFFAPDRLVEVGVALADIALFPEAADHRGGGLLRFALCRLLSYLPKLFQIQIASLAAQTLCSLLGRSSWLGWAVQCPGWSCCFW